MKYGYDRVSTDDQTAALQLAALKPEGCKTKCSRKLIDDGQRIDNNASASTALR